MFLRPITAKRSKLVTMYTVTRHNQIETVKKKGDLKEKKRRSSANYNTNFLFVYFI